MMKTRTMNGFVKGLLNPFYPHVICKQRGGKKGEKMIIDWLQKYDFDLIVIYYCVFEN